MTTVQKPSDGDEQLIDFTTNEVAGFAMARKIIDLYMAKKTMCRAATILAAHLHRSLLLLALYNRKLEAQPLLEKWKTECPVLFGAIRGLTLRVNSQQVPECGDVTIGKINSTTLALKKQMVEAARTLTICAYHCTNGCPKGSDCLYCLQE